MNKYFAKIFSELNLAYNVIVVFLLFGILIYDGIWFSLGINSLGSRIVVIVLAFFAHLWSAGLISTLISINEHLGEISEKLDEHPHTLNASSNSKTGQLQRLDPPLKNGKAQSQTPTI